MVKNSSTNKTLFIWMAQKEHLDALHAKPKTSALCKEPFLKKTRKHAKSAHKKISAFWEILLAFLVLFIQ